MKYTEELLWILDKRDERGYSEELARQRIDFVHSLGRKCDCVGWNSLDLSKPGADEILDEIEAFCRKHALRARGYYTRKYVDLQSDWFELHGSSIDLCDWSERTPAPARDGSTIKIPYIKAYKETPAVPRKHSYRGDWFVPERFREACLKNNVPGISFCWTRDKGKYAAEQYFQLYVDHLLPRIICDRHLRIFFKGKIQGLGGYLPRLSEMFYELNISLPDCYFRHDLPEGGFAQAYSYGITLPLNRSALLIHRDTAELLFREKAISAGMLQAVPVVDETPAGYCVEPLYAYPRPTQEYMDEMLIEYEKLKGAIRPVRRVSQKEALKLMRLAKRERKDDFQKRMPKEKSALLLETAYDPLMRYYLVANGGLLSDEYELLSHDAALNRTDEFIEALAAEELLEDPPSGVIFAVCPDGDQVLLLEDGRVIRFSHEVPEAIAEWPSPEQFIFDAISECE